MLLAAVIAVVAIVGLNTVVAARERQLTPPPGPFVPAPSPLQSLGFTLAPVAGPVLLVSRSDAIPADVAPVLQVLADGGVALRRPPRLLPGPVAASVAASATASAAGAAILLPAASLELLSAKARGTCLELLAALVRERPAPTARCRPVAFVVTDQQLAAWLLWLP